jgi:hypothetical protein
MCMCVCICIYVCMHACIYTCIIIYIYTYMYLSVKKAFKVKLLIALGTYSQHFMYRYLRINSLSWSVSPWQAFPAVRSEAL